MNPELLVKLASQRTSDLRQEAVDARVSSSVKSRDSIRQRTGWALVQIGLRLALPARRTRRQVAH